MAYLIRSAYDRVFDGSRCKGDKKMSDTNVFIHGTGTANDPKTFEFHTSAESVMAPLLAVTQNQPRKVE
jgi:hypothetical protein